MKLNNRTNHFGSLKALLVILSSFGAVNSAQAIDFAIDAHAGLMGSGFGATVGVNRFFNVRGGLNTLEFNADFEEDGLDYSADLEFDNQYVFLDYHPFAGTFRFTLGFYNNNNGFSGQAISDAGEQLGDAADVINLPANSTISLDIDYQDSIAPYVGIGFGNAVRNGGGFGFSVDIGVVMTGNFDVNVGIDDATRAALNTAGTTNQQIDDAINAEIAEIENDEDFRDIDVWPLIQVGLSYGF